MKKQKMKWIKEYGWVLPVLLLVFSLAVAGSFAAYVNYNSAKKVVATGETTKVFFSSNYLYPVNQSETSYRLRRILPTMTADGTGYTFTVQICNYVYGNREQVNEKDITYHLIVSLWAADGGELPENSGSVTVNQTEIGNTGQLTTEYTTLPGKQAQMVSYTIFIPKKLRDTIRIEIVAEPDNASYAAVGNQKLAVILTIAEQKMVNTWTGRFIDDQQTDPWKYDGLNYEISGTGKGTITLTWSSSVLQISPWFLKDVNARDIGAGTCTFDVGGENQPDAYQLQFYKAEKNSFSGKSWEDLSGAVTVSFTERE